MAIVEFDISVVTGVKCWLILLLLLNINWLRKELFDGFEHAATVAADDDDDDANNDDDDDVEAFIFKYFLLYNLFLSILFLNFT